MLDLNTLAVDTSGRDLVVMEDEGVCNDDVLATGSSEDDDFSYVIGSKGLNSAVDLLAAHIYVYCRFMYLRIDGVSLGLVTTEADNRELLDTDIYVSNQPLLFNTMLVQHTVSTCPGSISITRIFVSISSRRRLSVKARTAALVAQ